MSLVMLGARRVGALGEPPPRRLTRRLLSPLGLARPRGRALDVAALFAHFTFGGAMGGIWGLLPGWLKTPGGGRAFGFAVWAVNYAGVLPQLGLMPPVRKGRRGRPTAMIAAHLVFGAALAALERRLSPVGAEVKDKVVVICGGSRGLGRTLAHELAAQGARVAICGRSPTSLRQTQRWLEGQGLPVLAAECDLRDPAATQAFVARVARELPIDVLIANAATIDVGPIQTLTPEDFDAAMDEIFGSAVNAVLSVLPAMRARGRGSIALVSSIGGQVGIPHLAAYSSAKFALSGFAETLAAEVGHDGVQVLTVSPGLMRTGSHVHAQFRGDRERELIWFGTAAMAPLLTISAERAARHIVRAIARGERVLTFTPAAHLANWLHQATPTAWSFLIRCAALLLPRSSAQAGAPGRAGAEVIAGSSSRLVRFIGRMSAPLLVEHGQ